MEHPGQSSHNCQLTVPHRSSSGQIPGNHNTVPREQVAISREFARDMEVCPGRDINQQHGDCHLLPCNFQGFVQNCSHGTLADANSLKIVLDVPQPYCGLRCLPRQISMSHSNYLDIAMCCLRIVLQFSGICPELLLWHTGSCQFCENYLGWSLATQLTDIHSWTNVHVHCKLSQDCHVALELCLSKIPPVAHCQLTIVWKLSWMFPFHPADQSFFQDKFPYM